MNARAQQHRASGHSAGGSAMKRLPIGFDAETFATVETSAAAAGVSFAQRIRELVEIGLECEQQEKAEACSTLPATKKVTSSAMSSGSSLSR